MAQKTVTNNNVTFSSSIKEIGSYSGYFNGSNAYLSVPSSTDIDLGNGDFTLDLWVRFTALPASGGYMMFYRQYDGVHGGSVFYIYKSGSTYYIGFNQIAFSFSRTITPSINTWYHFTVIRSGNDYMIFVDGVKQGATYTNSGDSSYAGAVCIGSDHDGTGFFLSGYVDECRVSKGLARWTSNFTPPSAPYTTDSYTKLLLHLENNVTDDSVASGTTYNLSFSEGLTGSDSIADNIKRAFAEGLTGSDSLVKTIKRNFAESATVSDIINKIIGSHFNDSRTASDLLTQKILKYCTDSITGSDSASIAIVKLLTFNDSATASESITTLKHIIKTFTETATASDVINYKITRNFHDYATGLDSLSKKILFNLSDSGTGIDSITLTKILSYFFNALLLIID